MISKIDKEKAKKSIALILDRIKTEADPKVLSEYRSIFKKEVSLFGRSWAAAYLLMCFDQGGMRFRGNQGRTGRYYKAQPENSDSSGKTQEKEFRVRQYPLAVEDSKRIFMNIGRNRRVFPREILGLIISKTGVSRDDVGAIRILENYSFVQVRDTVSDMIIEALNGYSFRGRILTVNYARVRKDEDDNSDDDVYPETNGTDFDGDNSEQD